jgi:3-hydroxybutyryl-CoA dehydratase
LTIPGLLEGSMLTHIGSLLGFLATEMSFEYLAPVFVGDSVYCTVTIVEKDEEAKRRVAASAGLVNRDGVEVLRARFSGFLGCIRLAR